MTYRSRQILSILLPIVFWLLAGGCLFIFYQFAPYPRWEGASALFLMWPLFAKANHRIGTWAKEAFTSAVLIGFSSYWIPTLLFLAPIVVLYMATQRMFNVRLLLGALLGYVSVAIYATLFISLHWIANPWFTFFCPNLLWGWIPIIVLSLALIGTGLAHNRLSTR